MLADEGADYGSILAAEGVASYVIGDCEEDERMQVYVEVGRWGFVGGDEGSQIEGHGDGCLI